MDCFVKVTSSLYQVFVMWFVYDLGMQFAQ